MIDALEFLLEFNRMCRYYGNDCEDCPRNGESCCFASTDTKAYLEKFIEDVKKWSEEHPEKTRLTDFKEKYPNVRMDADMNVPANVCCRELGYCSFCRMNCKECWNEPLEDVK